VEELKLVDYESLAENKTYKYTYSRTDAIYAEDSDITQGRVLQDSCARIISLANGLTRTRC
jgi:hypothetical protein